MDNVYSKSLLNTKYEYLCQTVIIFPKVLYKGDA